MVNDFLSTAPEQSEQALLHAAQQGDHEAFDALLTACLPQMFRQAVKLMGNDSDAEDMVQEASLRMLKGIGSFKGEASVATWATRITLNCCYDHFRKFKNKQTLPLDMTTEEGSLERPIPDERPTAIETIEQNETIMAVRKVAMSLKEPYRTTLISIDLLQKSYDEVARSMGVPLGTVKSRLARARAMAGKALKRLMEPNDVEPRQTGR